MVSESTPDGRTTRCSLTSTGVSRSFQVIGMLFAPLSDESWELDIGD